jgi:hypothetical protein
MRSWASTPDLVVVDLLGIVRGLVVVLVHVGEQEVTGIFRFDANSRVGAVQ